MNLKTSTTIYWAGAVLISLWFGASGFFELTNNPIVWGITVKLGYPPHFIYILGVAKLTGVAVILTPNRLLRLKEWVIAGIYFDILFAFFSKLAVLGFAAITASVSAKQFFRVNRQYLVNFKAIKEVEHYFLRKLYVKLIIETPDKLLINKEKSHSFLNWMEER